MPKYVHTITEGDVRHPFRLPFALQLLNTMGRLLPTDVGKRVYKVGEVYQVENREQRDRRLQDLLCCALEGGSNYWYQIKKFSYPHGQTKESMPMEFRHLELPFKGGSLLIGVSESSEYDRLLDRAAIDRSIQLLAKKYPKHYADFVAENEDAITGDVFLQLALFGEVVFG